MNIFILGETPQISAQYHCNKHVVKMIVESGQILSTCHWRDLLLRLGVDFKNFSRISDAKRFVEENFHFDEIPLYAPTHPNHPCTLWAGETLGNYCWTLELMRGLLDEYSLRYGKRHKSESAWEWLNNPPSLINPDPHTTPHRQAVPEDCRIPGDAIAAYRKCYLLHKKHFAKWSVRSTPFWFSENL